MTMTMTMTRPDTTNLALASGGLAIKSGPPGSGRVGGLLVTYRNPDRSKFRDYFTEATDFGEYLKHAIPLLYHHAMKEDEEDFGDLIVTPGPRGLEARGRLSLAEPRGRALYEAVKRGGLSWSSGAVFHRVRRTRQPDSTHRIDRWHIVEGSLTDNPADPHAVATAVKGLDGPGFDRLRVEREGLAYAGLELVRTRQIGRSTWPYLS
jgi:phage head maturation protease